MEIDWKKFFGSVCILYVIVFITFKVFTMAFFPDFYFGPFHALSLLLILFLFAGLVEYIKDGSLDERPEDQALTNAAVILIASVVQNNNNLEIPAYLVKSVAEKLNNNQIVLNIEEKDDKYILSTEVIK